MKLRQRRCLTGAGWAAAALTLLLLGSGAASAGDDGVRPSLKLGSVTVHRQRQASGPGSLETVFHLADSSGDGLAWSIIFVGLAGWIWFFARPRR